MAAHFSPIGWRVALATRLGGALFAHWMARGLGGALFAHWVAGRLGGALFAHWMAGGLGGALFAHWMAGSLGERAWRYTFRPLGVGCFIKNGFVQSPAVSCVRCFTRNHNNRKCRQSIGVAFALLYQLGVLPGRLRQESAQLQALPLHPVSSLRLDCLMILFFGLCVGQLR